MEPKDPISDEQLSSFLRKWQTPDAPSSLEARVFRLRRARVWQRHPWLVLATSSALAAGGYAGYVRLTDRQPQQLQVSTVTLIAATSAARCSTPSELQESLSVPIPKPIPTPETRHSPPPAAPQDAKPAPAEEQANVNYPYLPPPPGVYRIGNGVSAPSVVEKVTPPYSDEGRASGLAGTVKLSVVVGKDGSATDVRVFQQVGLGLDERAVEAVRKWKFKPGFKDGNPVPVIANIDVNFRLSKASSWTLIRAIFDTPPETTRPALLEAPRHDYEEPEERTEVRVSFEIDENGVPINFHAQSTPSVPRRESEAIALLSGWQFRPGMKDGKPVSVPGTFTFVRTKS